MVEIACALYLYFIIHVFLILYHYCQSMAQEWIWFSEIFKLIVWSFVYINRQRVPCYILVIWDLLQKRLTIKHSSGWPIAEYFCASYYIPFEYSWITLKFKHSDEESYSSFPNLKSFRYYTSLFCFSNRLGS